MSGLCTLPAQQASPGFFTWWAHGSKSSEVRRRSLPRPRLVTHSVTSAPSWSEQFTRLFQIPTAISAWGHRLHLMMGGTAKRCGIFARNTFIVLSLWRLGWRTEVVSRKTSQTVGRGHMGWVLGVGESEERTLCFVGLLAWKMCEWESHCWAQEGVCRPRKLAAPTPLFSRNRVFL